MFFLPWWVYVLLGTVTFICALLGQWLANVAQLGVEQPDDGPFPCFAHLGTDEDGAEDWCGQLAGHEGDCLGMRQYFDAEETVFTREWPDEDGPLLRDGEDLEYLSPGIYGVVPAPLPELPQRLSKVPAQTEHNDPWPFCGEQKGVLICTMAKGHPHEHKYA